MTYKADPHRYDILIDEVLGELKFQDEKWGKDRKQSYEKWMVILGEEYGEACKDVLEYTATKDTVYKAGLREELIQVAAVAVAIVEAIDLEEKTKWETFRESLENGKKSST